MSIAATFDQWWVLDTATGCHEWTRSLTNGGYGQLFVRGSRRPAAAHRFAWERAHGSVPNGLHVLHRCDNRKCVNVEHLFLGTNNDNIADKTSKGRAIGPALSGENHPSAKLTVRQVASIRKAYATGKVSQHLLSALCGVSQPVIGSIIRGETWKPEKRLTKIAKMPKAKRETIAQKFDQSWELDTATGCWVWALFKRWDGYASISVNGRKMGAHRYSYIRHHGPVPVGMVVRHKCDNPSCVNPAHLTIGTQADNVRDMMERNRAARKGATGERNSHAKLNADSVRLIRARIAAGETRKTLASAFGVSTAQIGHVVSGKAWGHVH